MPNATAAPEGTLSFTYSYSQSFTRNSVFFQYTPWGSVTLRYGGNGAVASSGVRPNYDRSADLAFYLLRETSAIPSLSLGMQDVIGTGAYAGEYLAIGKTSFDGRLHVNVGLGWGRLASNGSFPNPLGQISSNFRNRPARDIGRGGRPNPQEWFTGETAPFMGLSYEATESLTLKVEYSSDNYTKRQWPGTLNSQTPLNFGAQYQFSSGIIAHLNYLQGAELAFGVTFHTNVRKNAAAVARTPAPPFVYTGESGWTPKEYTTGAAASEKLDTILQKQGMRIVGFDVIGEKARVAFENNSFDAPAQAYGRVARWLTFVLPPEISKYELSIVRSGMPLAKVTINRNDLEIAEHELFGPERLEVKSSIEAATTSLNEFKNVSGEPLFAWGVSPYAQLTLFDPDEPRRADVGLQIDLHLTNGLGLEVAGSFRKRILGNRNEGRGSNSVLPRVRTEQVRYDQSDDLIVKDLYAARYGKLADNVFARVTAGYFEQMYAGISTEALWAPLDSPWSLGAEANYVAKREYDGLFGLQDYRVFTGHVTAQYTTNGGTYFKVAAGQYLAGDKGATFTVGRKLMNGWDLSAYTTFTDVSFADFGEGSFDKGVRLEIPVAALFGMQSRDRSRIGIRSITRDGGARLEIPGRLMEMTEGYHRRDIQASWPRVLR